MASTKPVLTAEINTNLPDNTSGLITPALLRTTLIDMVNSWFGLVDPTNTGTSLTLANSTTPVNSVTITSANTGSNPQVQAAGSDTNIGLLLSTKGTGGVQVTGTGTNDNAPAGVVGEFISSNVPLGSAVSLTNVTAANVTSISLTAGDWDVFGNVVFVPAAGTTIAGITGYTSTVSNTLPTKPNNGAYTENNATLTTGFGQTLAVGTQRLSLSATTTVYLGAFSNFGVSTMGACGFIGARRRR